MEQHALLTQPHLTAQLRPSPLHHPSHRAAFSRLLVVRRRAKSSALAGIRACWFCFLRGPSTMLSRISAIARAYRYHSTRASSTSVGSEQVPAPVYNTRDSRC